MWKMIRVRRSCENCLEYTARKFKLNYAVCSSLILTRDVWDSHNLTFLATFRAIIVQVLWDRKLSNRQSSWLSTSLARLVPIFKLAPILSCAITDGSQYKTRDWRSWENNKISNRENGKPSTSKSIAYSFWRSMLHINRLHCVSLPDFRALSFKHANYGDTLFTNGPRNLDWNNNNRYSKSNVIICEFKIKGMVAVSFYAGTLSVIWIFIRF